MKGYELYSTKKSKFEAEREKKKAKREGWKAKVTYSEKTKKYSIWYKW